MSYNAEHVKRLELAHEQAILESTKQLKHWEGIKTVYNHLAAKLKTLPDKMSHDVMVPFGPLAFSPGKLIHTNELLVHLGDSWFAEVTCKQGLKIIDHRLAAVDKNIEDIGFTVKNFKKKSEFSQHLNNDGDKNAVEIKEEVSNQYLHPSRRKRISRVKEKSPVRSKVVDRNPTKPPIVDEGIKEKCFNDGAFMSRLDELEKFEEEEDRLLLESNLLEDNENPDVRIQTSTSDSKKRVSWSSKVIQGHDADSDDSDDVTNTTTIKITHTNVTSHPSNSKQGTSDITSPADIGRKTSEPKSILKPTSSGPKPESNDSNPILPDRSQISNITTVRTAERKFDVVISDYVQEHKETIKQPVVPITKRPVSKFKSSRIK
nr:unconventional prefoldin RPB5 interactor [Ciona intestinalis]|eukprot:XP_009861789.1 unconventional prefoldin RPB5 interactor [Ciona intestinalis]